MTIHSDPNKGQRPQLSILNPYGHNCNTNFAQIANSYIYFSVGRFRSVFHSQENDFKNNTLSSRQVVIIEGSHAAQKSQEICLKIGLVFLKKVYSSKVRTVEWAVCFNHNLYLKVMGFDILDDSLGDLNFKGYFYCWSIYTSTLSGDPLPHHASKKCYHPSIHFCINPTIPA